MAGLQKFVIVIDTCLGLNLHQDGFRLLCLEALKNIILTMKQQIMLLKEK